MLHLRSNSKLIIAPQNRNFNKKNVLYYIFLMLFTILNELMTTTLYWEL